MIELTRDLEYEKELITHLQSRLPDKVYDAHFHINRNKIPPEGDPAKTPYEFYFNFTEKYLGKGRLQGGFVMGPPAMADTIDEDNRYNLNLAAEKSLDAGLLVSPGCGREKVEAILDRNPQIKALKPYLTYMPKEVWFESDMLDFAPEWMWELANDRNLPIIIHLSHYGNMLNEPANYEQIRYVSEKFLGSKIILAHCAMGHHIRKMRLGLEHIKDLKNIWFDCSSSTEALSIYYCLKEFGVDRMMFGGDHSHGASEGRICSYGSNFIAFHPMMVVDKAGCPRDYKYQPLPNLLEGLVSLFDAGELLGLKDAEWEKIFYTNAKELFSGSKH